MMRGRLPALFWKDLRLITRRRMLLTVLILYPFVFMAIVGLTFSGGRSIAVGVVLSGDAEEQRLWIEGQPLGTRELVERFLGVFTEIRYFEDREEAVDKLRRHMLDAVLVFPEGFLEALKTLDKKAKVTAILDESNPWAASAGESTLRSSLSLINKAVVEEKLRAVEAGLRVLITGGDFFGSEIIGMKRVIRDLEEVREALEDPSLRERLKEEIKLARTVVEDIEDASTYLRATAMPLDLEVVGVSGEALRLDSGLLPLLLGLSTLWTGILCAAALMSMDEATGMRVRLRVAGIPAFLTIGSKALVAAAVAAAQSLIMSITAVLLSGAPAKGIAPVLLIACVTSLSSIGIGIIIAAFSRETSTAVVTSVLVSLPLIFLSGAVFPLGQMPGWLRILVRLLPFTWAFEAMGGAMLRDDSAGAILSSSAVILGMGIVLLGAGVLAMRKRD